MNEDLCLGEGLICVEECPMNVFGDQRSFQMLGKEMALASMHKDNCSGSGSSVAGFA